MEQSLSTIPWVTVFERLLAAILCGALIGIEREFQRKQAGLRTMILICMGSALYITVSQLASLSAEQPFDITRVAAQVVTGVGFLGAGTIIVARGQIHGLTTAATIWTIAAVGLVIGAGYTLLGLAVTVLILVILTLIRPIEHKFFHRDDNNDMSDEDKAEAKKSALLP